MTVLVDENSSKKFEMSAYLGSFKMAEPASGAALVAARQTIWLMHTDTHSMYLELSATNTIDNVDQNGKRNI